MRHLLVGCIVASFANADAFSASSKPTVFVYGDRFFEHQTGAGHPERPERLSVIVKRLKAEGLLEKLQRIDPVPASLESIGAVHSKSYIERLKRACAEAPGFLDSPDTPVSADSYTVARDAVGGVLSALDAVMAGAARNGFCAIRPPGHHAMADKAMGFCLFNNVAIAARYLQQKHRLKRVLIIDWDVHHGNGTQAIFESDPSVFFFSVHQHPLYPQTGRADEAGTGPAVGTKLNVPLPAGAGDSEWVRVFRQKLVPAAEAFKPEFILISAGFDASAGDPLGGMELTPAGYAELTGIVMEMAQRHCHGRVVSLLEGGYNLEDLARCVEAHLRVLMGGSQ